MSTLSITFPALLSSFYFLFSFYLYLDSMALCSELRHISGLSLKVSNIWFIASVAGKSEIVASVELFHHITEKNSHLCLLLVADRSVTITFKCPLHRVGYGQSLDFCKHLSPCTCKILYMSGTVCCRSMELYYIQFSSCS